MLRRISPSPQERSSLSDQTEPRSQSLATYKVKGVLSAESVVRSMTLMAANLSSKLVFPQISLTIRCHLDVPITFPSAHVVVECCPLVGEDTLSLLKKCNGANWLLENVKAVRFVFQNVVHGGVTSHLVLHLVITCTLTILFN